MAIAKGLTQVSWPGRLERLPQGRLAEATMEGVELWIDGGHNPGAGKVIAEAMANLEERDSRPLFLITGMINTKDPVGYFEAFAGMARHVFAVPVPASDASIDPELLADAADEAGLTAESAESVEAAIDAVTRNWNRLEPAPRILIGGSLYLLGDVLERNGTPPK
jgi:dihydrofolate synthase/folylpolyglutamate synthase